MPTSRTNSRLQNFRWFAGILALMLLVAAWPLSYLRFGIALEKTPTLGWRVTQVERWGTDFDGGFISIEADQFSAFYVVNVPHTPVFALNYRALDAETRYFFVVGRFDQVMGVAAIGRFAEGWPASPTWTQKTGVIFPLWPVSILAACFLFRALYRTFKCRCQPSSLCPACSYDLRAHAPGAKCPECGTLVLPTSRS